MLPRWDRGSERTRGAAALEFALIVPVLFALIFGIVEAGWAMEQQHDVRGDAQQLARRASINFSQTTVGDLNTSVADLCSALDISDDALITIELPDASEKGDRVVVTVEQDLQQITGFFGNLLTGKTVTGTATAVLEQDASFLPVADEPCGAGMTAPAQPTPTPTPVPNCVVPNFDGTHRNMADGTWSTAGFTGPLTDDGSNGNFRIRSQTLSAGSLQPCNSHIMVGS